MKSFKKFLAVATAGVVIASVGALAACGGKPEDDPSKDTTPQIAYQFVGEFTNDTLRGFGFDYFIMLNLYDNNKVTGSGYNCLSMDTRASSENDGFGEKWFRGSWEATKDEEDQDCVKLTAIYDVDAKNGMNGSALTNTSTYYIYKKAGSEELGNFRLQSPIFSGTSEYMTEMSQNKTPYKTADDFIKANAFKESLPTDHKAVFEDSKAMSRIYLMDEGKANVYSGKKDPANNQAKYVKGETWEWSYADGKLIVTSTSNNTKTPYEATVNGNAATLEFKVNLMGNEMNYSYTCADISKLTPTEVEPPIDPPVTEPTALVTLSTEDGKTVIFYDDGTVKVETGIPQLSPTWRWIKSDDTVTFKNADNDSEPSGLTYSVEGNTATLVYAPAFLQGTSLTYTGDISALLA